MRPTCFLRIIAALALVVAVPFSARASDVVPAATRAVRRDPAAPDRSLSTLHLFAAKTWAGGTSTDWATAANWSPSGVPGSADDVTIPANVASGNYPVVSTGTANAKTITLAAGAGTAPTLNVTGGTLTIAATLTINNGTVTQSGGTVTVTTILTIASGATLTQSAGTFNLVSTGSITGTYNLSGGSFFGQATVTVNSGGNVNVSGTGVFHMAVNIGTAPTDAITISAGGNMSLAGSGAVDVKDFTTAAGSPGGAFTQTGGTFKQYHDFKSSGTYTATAGTIEFAAVGAAGNWPSTTGATQFYNVLLDVDPGFDANAAIGFSVAGDWTANAAVDMSAKATTVTFNGTGAQSITGSATTTFANLTINKSSGSVTLGHVEALTGGNLTVTAGTLDLATFTMNRSAAGGTLSVAAGATLRIGGTNTFPTNYTTHTLNATSTVEYYGTNQTVTAETYGNLTLSTSGTKTMPGSTTTVAGTFTTSGTISATAGAVINFNGDVTLGSGTTFNASSFSHVMKGTWTNNGATFTAGTSTFTFNGSSGQTIAGSSRSSFNNLTLNNSSGLTLSTSATVNGTMTFSSGTVTTGSNVLIIGPSGSVTQTSGFVIGNLRKQISAAGSVSKTFEVGTGTSYSPVTVALTGVAGQASDSTQYLTASATSGDHPNIATAGINAAKSVNRYWTLAAGGSWSYTSHSTTFTFVAGDVDAGASTSSFLIKRYSGAAWNSTTTGTLTSTTSQATGVSGFGDFAIGELGIVRGVSVSSGTSSASNLPSNGTNYIAAIIFQNTGTASDSYDLLLTHLPGTILTTVSMAGTSITQGSNKDSARVAGLAAGAVDTATVTYSVAMAANGSKDTLALTVRSVGDPLQASLGRHVVTVITPNLAVARAISPTGTQVIGTDLTYADTVTNTGSASANTVIVVDSISTSLEFKVGSVSTSFPVSVAVEYSNDGGSTWTYTPVSGGCSGTSGYDRCVNRLRVRLLAALSQTPPNNKGYLTYIARIR